jgi:dTDP-4-amino-4,6-dideoxygalactose transaminase
MKAELLEAMERVLDHGQFILGPEVAAFEQRIADYCGVPHAIGVDNGTNALILVLQALGIGPGDEVITAPNSFLASASCIALVGARPVFVDVRADFTLDPELIERAITPRTKAILPVHLTGRPADMEAILAVAARHGLQVVEDCAQAIGAELGGRKVGTFGVAGCFSLHPLKILNAVGDGGFITTRDADLARILRQARNHGLRTRDACEFWSGNCRLDTLQAAMLLVKLDHLERWIELRRAVAGAYRERLQGVVTVPTERLHERAVYQTFVIQSDQRDALQRFLAERGIDTKIHYPIPLHLQPAAKSLGWVRGAYPVAERQADTILSLPIYPELTAEQIEHLVDSTLAFFR